MLKQSTRLVAAVCTVLMGISIAATVGVAQGGGSHDHASPDRIARLATALGLQPGSTIADVGAGGGDYTVKLAREVGEAGRVYAVDISASALNRLRSRVSSENLQNVQVIEGAVDDPRLPAAALDAALIVNAYHEMTDYPAMLRRIREALKPDGRLVIVEPIADSARDRSRDQQTRQHQISPDIVLRDLKAAGFDVVALEDPFKASHAHDDHSEWLMVATPSAKLQTPKTESRFRIRE
jgi:cyclopropane fatty-acyl-phospholipid synthase-like methyltransferase